MSFEKRKIRTSVLIRWHEDGRIGAHESGIDQVFEDGVLFSAKETPPVPLGTGDFPSSKTLESVLGGVTVQALLQIDQTEHQLALLEDERDAALEDLTQANQRVTSLEAQLKSVLEEVDRLTAYATSVDAVADIPETPLA